MRSPKIIFLVFLVLMLLCMIPTVTSAGDTGHLWITTNPSGTEIKIWIDGILHETGTPIWFDTSVGTYGVKIHLDGYFDAEKTRQTEISIPYPMNVPVYPSPYIPAIGIIGFLGVVFYIKRNRKH